MQFYYEFYNPILLDTDVEKVNDSNPREWIGEDIVLELVSKLQLEVAA